MAVKQCSKCGKEFGCGNEKPGCWCENYEIPLQVLQQLKNEFANCLCEACLRTYAIDPDPIKK